MLNRQIPECYSHKGYNKQDDYEQLGRHLRRRQSVLDEGLNQRICEQVAHKRGGIVLQRLGKIVRNSDVPVELKR